MNRLLTAAIVAAVFATTPALAQESAYPTPDNNLTRSDDVDPSEAPYLNDEFGRPSADFSAGPESDGIIVDDGGDGASAGESGEGLPPENTTDPDD